ncbi:MAG: sugar transferase [Tannerella sp.]|jgi:lipopolysaccharide/colanic/teichoic acid biosynthesis glycosyltransferase|nr:sugar transferase [Tannerella sp.]
MYRRYIKRFIDFSVALAGLIVLSPVFLIISVLLGLNNKGKIFYIQQRPGKNERIFNIVKFRTMNDRRDAEGRLLPDSERITPAGRFLRNTSLDEIPQLLNVISGDMSLVGPRPLLVEYLPHYSETHRQRHDVRPGITGWAQVNGRNTLTWTQKFDYDVYYVKKLSFLLDIKILYLTIKKVFKQDGINYGDQPTIGRFR